MKDAVLRAIDLVMRYKDVRVLNGLNLQVAEGSVFGLIGPNGAGKTTTIKTFMNQLRIFEKTSNSGTLLCACECRLPFTSTPPLNPLETGNEGIVPLCLCGYHPRPD